MRAEFTTEKNARVSDSNTLEEVATTVYLQKTDVSKLGELRLPHETVGPSSVIQKMYFTNLQDESLASFNMQIHYNLLKIYYNLL